MKQTFPIVVTGGFATGVTMWFVAYLVHLPGFTVAPALTGIALVLVQFGGCLIMSRGKRGLHAIGVGAGTGLVSSAVNLLILGSLIAETTPEASAVTPSGSLVALGSLLFGAVVGAVGGSLAGIAFKSGAHAPGGDSTDWRSRFAIVAAFATLPVLLSGGIVTSTESGMAVPDWPTSFGANMFLLPLGKMTGGVLLEHAHRLFGSLAGLCVVVLSLWVALTERNALVNVASLLILGVTAILSFVLVGTLHNVVPSVGIIVALAGAFSLSGWCAGAATAALALIIMQGVLGGIRVLADSSVLAFVHGIMGQMTFAYLCVLAALLSPAWSRSAKRTPDRFLRTGASVLLGLVMLQLVLGAGTRHFEQHAAFMHPHILGALLVIVTGTMIGFRARSRHRDVRALRLTGTGVAHTSYLQFGLGMVTIALVLLNRDEAQSPAIEIVFATAHQGLGAALFGMCALLWVWTRRLLESKMAGAIEMTPAG